MIKLSQAERDVLQCDIKKMFNIERYNKRIIELLDERCDDSVEQYKRAYTAKNYEQMLLLFENSIIRYEIDWIENLMIMYCTEEFRAVLFDWKFNNNLTVSEYLNDKLNDAYINMIREIYTKE